MIPRIGFINPSAEYLHDPFRGDPHAQFQLLTILDDYLDGNADLRLIDLRGIKKEFAHRHIPECDLYLHSVYTVDEPEQKQIVANLRSMYPGAKHVAGGPHANLFPDEIKKTYDSLVLGDADETIKKVVDDLMNGGLKEVYRQQGRIDINNYPVPSRRFLPKSSTARKGMMTLRGVDNSEDVIGTTVIFSRGCPYSCAFCEIPNVKSLNPGMRIKEPKLIEKEIEYLKKEHGIQGINLLDEIGIPLSPKKAVSRLEAIARTEIIWRGQCRVDGIDSDLAKLMKESGCVAMALGVESVSQKVLDLMDKKIKIEDTKKTLYLLKENNIQTRLYMVMNLPGEPDDIVDQTKRFVEEVQPDVVFLSQFTTRPGTPVFDNPEKYGIEWTDSDWTKNNHLFGRFGENEMPTLSFRYAEGKGPSPDEMLRRHAELQEWLREKGISNL